MAGQSKIVPTVHDLQGLPRWARVALCARAVRRVQPLYLDAWPKAPAKFQASIEASIAEGELAASQGKRTANLNKAGHAAMKVYGAAPDKITFSKEYVDDVPYAASRVALAGLENDALFADEAIEKALSAVFYFERSNQRKGLRTQLARLIKQDFEHIEKAARDGKWSNSTPVTPDAFGPLWPKGPPLGWPASSEVTAGKQTKSLQSQPALKDLRLPKDLVAFLKAGKQLKFNAAKSEVGPIQLKSIEELTLDTFEMQTEGTPAHANDPNRRKRGHYTTRAVDLVAECDAYGPGGILAWLLDDRVFGQWDPDHMQVIIFPKTTWSDIAARPARYLDAQWNEFGDFARHLEPWKHGVFQADR
jgi:hypothetical protein